MLDLCEVVAAPSGFGGGEFLFFEVGQDVVGGGEEEVGPRRVGGVEEVGGLIFEELPEGGLVAEESEVEFWVLLDGAGEDRRQRAVGDVAAEGADEGVAGGVGGGAAFPFAHDGEEGGAGFAAGGGVGS